MRRIQTRFALFDVFRTLLIPKPDSPTWHQAVAWRLDVPVGAVEAAWAELREDAELGHLSGPRWLSQLCDELGQPHSLPRLNDLYDHLVYITHNGHNLHLYARDLLGECRQEGAVGLLSTATAIGRDAARYFGLFGQNGGLATSATYSCDVGFRKPNPEIFRQACRATRGNASPDQFYHFDDALECAAGAEQAGLRGVLVLHEGGSTARQLWLAGQGHIIQAVQDSPHALVRWPLRQLDPEGAQCLGPEPVTNPDLEVYITTNLRAAVRQLVLEPGRYL